MREIIWGSSPPVGPISLNDVNGAISSQIMKLCQWLTTSQMIYCSKTEWMGGGGGNGLNWFRRTRICVTVYKKVRTLKDGYLTMGVSNFVQRPKNPYLRPAGGVE